MKLKASFTAPILAIVIFTLLYASRFIDVSKMGTGSVLFLSIIAIQLVVLMFPGAFYCRLKDSTYTNRLNLKLFSPGYFGYIVFTALALIAGVAIFRCVQVYVFNINDASFIPYFTGLSYGIDTSGVTYSIITFAAIPAISEEFIFRSVLFRDYQDEGVSDVATILVTSLLFAMLNFSIAQFPVYFLAGVTFAFVTYVTGSSIAAMITHFIFGLYTLFLDKYIVNVISKPDNIVFFLFVLVILFLIFAIFSFSEAERISRRNSLSGIDSPFHIKKRTVDQKWYISVRNVLTSPTFLACVGLFVIFSVFSA